MAHANQRFPIHFDARGPNFGREMLQWSQWVQSEIDQLVAGSHEAIATSNALMAEADRILARR